MEARRSLAGRDPCRQTRARYRERFAIARRLLGNHRGFRTPGGSFYLWLDVQDGARFAKALWQKTGVRVMPGAFMGVAESLGNPASNPGHPYVRVALVHDSLTIEAALERVADFPGGKAGMSARSAVSISRDRGTASADAVASFATGCGIVAEMLRRADFHSSCWNRADRGPGQDYDSADPASTSPPGATPGTGWARRAPAADLLFRCSAWRRWRHRGRLGLADGHRQTFEQSACACSRWCWRAVPGRGLGALPGRGPPGPAAFPAWRSSSRKDPRPSRRLGCRS